MTALFPIDVQAAACLARGDVFVHDAWLGAPLARALRAEVQALHAAGRFKAAGVGNSGGRALHPGIRGDHTCWFDATGRAGVVPSAAVAAFLARMESLVAHLNQVDFLALREVECQAAYFGTGAFYQAHVDVFTHQARRVITFCYYLNDSWTPDVGGCLRVHTPRPLDIAPMLDRLVLFRSADTLHEVLPTLAPRLSVTGWLSRR